MIQVKCVSGQARCSARTTGSTWQVSPIAESRRMQTWRGGDGRMAAMNFQRCAVEGGAILYDPLWGGNAPEFLFDREYWRRLGGLREFPAGRGSIAVLAHERGEIALRHYRRGGWPARIVADRYLYTGEARARSFRELELHSALRARGLPVPMPVAARYRHRAFSYEADLVTVLIPGTQTLASLLAAAPLAAERWLAIGACIARFHAAGVDHADLNAHNVLVDAQGRVFLVDFDRGRLRRPGCWRQRNLRRLRASLGKVTRSLDGRSGAADWALLLDGYRGAPAPPAPA
jgi:3-deoxy-D-manno-octulosonic acid kinase